MSAAGDDLDLLIGAARAAGAEALRLQGSLTSSDVTEKPGGAGPVSAGDLAADHIMKDMLLSARPDYGWLSEESPDNPARLSRESVFVVDPIDGTRAYLRGGRGWVISVALVRAGRPVAGVLYQPADGAMYVAERGRGAWRDGEMLRVSDRAGLAGGRLLCTAGTLSPKKWRAPWPDSLRTAYSNSIALRMALVARGEWNGALALSAKNDWDLAAADLILEEAGGIVTGLDGALLRYNEAQIRKPGLVCGAPDFHAALMRRLDERR